MPSVPVTVQPWPADATGPLITYRLWRTEHVPRGAAPVRQYSVPDAPLILAKNDADALQGAFALYPGYDRRCLGVSRVVHPEGIQRSRP